MKFEIDPSSLPHRLLQIDVQPADSSGKPQSPYLYRIPSLIQALILSFWASNAGIVWILLNVAAVILLVTLNKIVLHSEFFPFPTALTFLHACTACAFVTFLVQSQGGNGTEKQVSQHGQVLYRMVAMCAVLYSVFLITSNLSTKYNTLTEYQVFKVLITPVMSFVYPLELTGFMKWSFYGSVGIVSAGALMTAGINIFDLSEMGAQSLLFGSLSLFGSVAYQVQLKRSMQTCSLSAQQLMYLFLPVALVPTLTAVAAAEGIHPAVMSIHSLTAWQVTVLFIDCMLGCFVTFSMMKAMQLTNPLTYGIISHLKTIGVFSVGFIRFRDTISAFRIVGVFFIIFGLMTYTLLEAVAKKQLKFNLENGVLCVCKRRFASPPRCHVV